MSLCDRYLRWRHSKGFGVHSPFAYRFVTDVLKPGPYRFYSFDEIDRYLHGDEFHDHRFLRRVKFIIRLANFLGSDRLLSYGKTDRAVQVASQAMEMKYEVIHPSDKFEFNTGDLLILHTSMISLSKVKEALESEVAVLASDPTPDLRELLETPLERGLLLADRRVLLLIPRSQMHYIRYDITLI